MKKLVILLISLLLVGCSSVNENDVFNRLDNTFSSYEKKVVRSNNNTKYYSYYLPSDIQELDYDDSFHHFVFNASDFVMNLNVNGILCKEVFKTTPDDLFASYKDYEIYRFDSDTDTKYSFALYKDENNYFFSLITANMSYFGRTCLQDIEALASHLLCVDNSISVDIDKVVDAYYIGTIIDTSGKEPVDFYPHHIESNGLLENLFIDK